MTIGELAQRAGINASAIRYYERVGVLPEPERAGGRRHYSEDALRRLRILAVAKRAGFSLDEAKALLQTESRLPDLAARKLGEVEASIARHEAMRDWLAAATHCTCETFDACALFAGA